ncbi:MAG: hypothetical protein IPG50_25610 [Myxococcales bacterium]|nr:hypothetical protein [Myxococcales bacterium]
MSTEPPPSPDARLCALIRRELGAGDVRVVAAADAPAESQNTMQAKLGDGRVVVATFFDTPEERDVLVRRLDMLASTFSLGLSEPPHKERGPVAKALHEELRALATRAQACDALVLDGQSPVVWSSATGTAEELDEALRLIELCRLDFIRDARPEADAANSDAPQAAEGSSPELPAPLESSLVLRDVDGTPEASLRAMQDVRNLPEMAGLRRGKALHHIHRGRDFGYVAKSFAGIYLLVLVFDEAFDELRAERALSDAMPRIERLVLALPPRDPSPLGPEGQGNVVAFRRRR